jgi:hypothetical protein
MSNYAEIDMHDLSSLILEGGSIVPTIDLTPKVLTPYLIATSKIRDTFEILSFKKEPTFRKLYEDEPNKIAALSSSSLKMVEYDE